MNTYIPGTDAVIELGGEDAKIIFFGGALEERMNGSCAGGTGAFIDQMATLMNVSVDELDALSLKHEKIYPIASRCGVFAKSDIQPILNKVDPGGVGHSQSGGAGNDHLHLPARQHVRNGPEGLAGPLPGLGVVPLIGAEQQLVLFVQHHHLDRGGADVDADTKTHKLKMLLTFVSMLTD